MKKIFAMFLILTMMANFIISAPVYAEGKLDDNVSVVEFLKALDIVDEGYFEDPDYIMNRGEMIELVVDFMDCETQADAYSGTIQFYDIDKTDDYYKDICYAAANAFCHGADDGMIHAYDNATVFQAIITFVNALGLRNMAVAMGGEKGYKTIAENTGISDGLKQVFNQELTRKFAIQLLYNVLLSNVYDVEYIYESGDDVHNGYGLRTDTTYLYERFEIYEIEGIVTSTPFASIDNGVADKGNIYIDSKEYTNPNSYAEDMIGRKVVAYVKDNKDATNEIIYIHEQEDVNILTAFTNELSDYDQTDRIYEYFSSESEKTKTLKLTTSTEFIYNGKPIEELSAELVKPRDGKLTFIDNNDDNKYDYVIIESFTTMLVESINTDNHTLFDSVANYKLDYGKYGDNVYVFDSDKNALSIEDIENDNILTVVAGEESLKLYVSRDIMWDTINGRVAKGDVTYFKMTDDIEYPINDYFSLYCPDGQKVGQNGDFYLDIFGRITYMKNSLYNNLGYVLQIASTGEFKSQTRLKLLNIYGKIEEVSLSERVKIDGVKCDGYESAALQLSGVTRDESGSIIKKGLKNNIIIYELNDENEVTSIETAYDFNNTTGALEKEMSTGEISTKEDGLHMSYKFEDFTYNGVRSFDGKGLMNSSAKVFVVPVDSAGAVALDSPEYLEVQNVSYFKKWRKYTVDQYKINRENEGADIVVAFENAENYTMPEIADVMCVNEISEVITDNEDIVKQFTGYVLGNEKSYIARSEDIGEGVEKGDIIKFVLDSKQQITAMIKVYDESTSQMLEDVSSFANSFRVLIRPVYKMRGNAIITAEKDELPKIINENDYEGFFVDSSIPVYKVDKDVRRTDISEIVTYEQDKKAYSKLFLYTSQGNIKMAVIYD